jgi:hypothetical protein
MGNLATKIFHANSDAVTNEYASRLFGSSLKQLENSSTQAPRNEELFHFDQLLE